MNITVNDGGLIVRLPKAQLCSFQERHNHNNPSFYLFGNEIHQKTTVKHVGVTLSSDLLCIERTVQACHTMHSLTMALLRSGADVAALNPVTCAKCVKTNYLS